MRYEFDAIVDLGPAHEQETLLAGIWEVRLPETETTLEAIGGHHPERRVAKAARKALFKHRTSRSR